MVYSGSCSNICRRIWWWSHLMSTFLFALTSTLQLQLHPHRPQYSLISVLMCGESSCGVTSAFLSLPAFWIWLAIQSVFLSSQVALFRPVTNLTKNFGGWVIFALLFYYCLLSILFLHLSYSMSEYHVVT